MGKRLGIIIVCLILAVTGIDTIAFAAVRYMPDVTAEMSKASYWIDKVGDPQRELTDMDQIKKLNQEMYEVSSGTNDLLNYPETFNGTKQVENLTKEGPTVEESGSLWQDALYDYNMGVKYYQDPNTGEWEALSFGWDNDDPAAHTAKNLIYRPMIENAKDPDAAENMPVKYAICTTRTCMQAFPSAQELYDDPDDPDFSYRTHTVIRVGEPLALRICSADGEYYMAASHGMRGWIPAKDIAICASREEWLSAWNTDDVLVVLDDKIYTEESNSTPQTAGRKLTMGTRLRLAAESEIGGRISNRTAHNNHVVWMPIRRADGTFTEELALIGENRKVSEGYLPVTTENILSVAMNQLGDTYGWGGMLESEDCSGFMVTVYSCFGFDLPRGVNRTNGVLKSWDLSEMSDNEKAAFIQTLPPGTILAFSGHEMMYLGYEGDKLYVISSVSNVMLDGVKTRVRGGVINTLDIKRANGNSWLTSLHAAEVPYLGSSDPDPQLSIASATVSGIKSKTYTGKALMQKPVVEMGGLELTAEQDYKISYKNNVKAGTASMTISGIGCYRDDLNRTFTIQKAANPLRVKAKGSAVKVSKKNLKKKSQTIKRAAAYTVSKGQGNITYSKVSVTKKKFAKQFTVNSKTGSITVKKGTKRGTYKLKIRVKAAGNANYKSLAKNVTVTIRVR